LAALLPVLGWRMIWRIGAFLILFAVLPLIILVVRQSPTAREGLHYVEDTSRAVPLHKPASLQAVRLRDILMRPNFWLLIGAYVPMLGLNDAVAQNLSPYVASLGWDQRTAAGLLSVLSFSNLLATLLLGIFSDRFGNRVPLLLLTGATATGGVLFALGGGLPVIALACAFIGFAGGINTLMAATLAAEFGAKGFGRAFGMSLFFIPFLPLSAVVTARVKEVSGSYTPAFFVLSVLLVTSFGFSSLFFRQKRNGSPSAAAAMAVLVHPAPPPS
jgi:sugar phosphate permease